MPCCQCVGIATDYCKTVKTVLVVCQADSALSGVFEAVDTVMKNEDTAVVQISD